MTAMNEEYPLGVQGGGADDGDCPKCRLYFPNVFNITNSTVAADYIFNRLDVQICLILAYTFVFCCCFFGNLLVMIVVILHRRMRTITNFFLVNLAVADLCVGLFCVYQNLSFYLTSHWAFGNFLCKMYHFVHSLSYTASIAILIVISVERYVAIVHPMLTEVSTDEESLNEEDEEIVDEELISDHQSNSEEELDSDSEVYVCESTDDYVGKDGKTIWHKKEPRKNVMTSRRLRIVSVTVWLVSAAYCSPRLIMYGTAEVPSINGNMETICILKRSFYDSKTYDLVNFIVCFVIPLIIISVLYSIICLRLWRSNQVSKHYGNTTFTARATLASRSRARSSSHPDNLHSMSSRNSYEMQDLGQSRTLNGRNFRASDIIVHDGQYTMTLKRPRCPSTELHPTSTCRSGTKNHVLQSRRKVIRLLVSVVLTFAFCNLPFHARKLWQNWSPDYDGTSANSSIFTIVTTLILYMNSGINPLLYAILSENFRASMLDIIMCNMNRMRRNRAATRSMIRNDGNSLTVRSISISQDDNDRNPGHELA
ncbi:Trissin receptor like protein [Argiope bruennichi]|uniref:Trissin receptor like protein n=1 Tax=Argiope bruennichi TaxID=94029 RepID=A0A8T0F1Q3_ARGBR|nr:Trissin receptor like protein [Argiope bruennichi]